MSSKYPPLSFAAANSSDESSENEDDFDSFNPRKRRKTGRNSKESAALGVFGSESEEDHPGRRWKKKTLRGRAMSFVQPGQKQGSEEEDEVEDEYPEGGEGRNEDEDEDEEMEDAPTLGLGASRGGLGAKLGSGPGPGLGAQMNFRPSLGKSGGIGSQSPAPSRSGLGTVDGDGTFTSPLGMGFRPTSEVLYGSNDDKEEKDEPQPVKRQAMPSAFSTLTNGRGAKAKGGGGGGTPINKMSFAARMMAKMGYKEGDGLGKEGQGRKQGIEVQLRPQGAGIGAVKEKSKQEREEEKRQAALRGEGLEDSEDEGRKKRRVRKARTSGVGAAWGAETMSGNTTPARKKKTKYASLQEVSQAAPGLKIPDAFMPILDMTGPGTKYLTSGSGLATPTAGVTEPTEVVEARKLARRAQNDLSSFVEEWKGLEERKAYIDLQMVQQQQTIDAQNAIKDQLSAAEEAVQGLSIAVKDGQWDPVITALIKLEALDVAGNDELASIAVAAVHPFLRLAVEGWQPLDDPKLSGVASNGFVSALTSIRHLVGMSADIKPHSLLVASLNIHRAHKTTPYESLMYTVWFPKVRSAITNTWDVHDPSSLLTLLDLWTPLLPAFIKSQILDNLVVRKLDEALQSWNPKKRSRTSQLPHLWLFPWFPYLPAHHLDSRSSSGLVADVERKFRTLIDSWDFRRGVIPGLTQWRDILRPSTSAGNDSWTPLLLNHVLPNLAKWFRENFQVAPQDQEPYMATLAKTFEWRDVLGDDLLGRVLVEELFPMWHDVLHQWLTLEGVNYLEIKEWFDFWRSIIRESVSETPAVKGEWRKGNELINKALDLGERAKTDLPAPSKPVPTVTSGGVPEVPSVPVVAPAQETGEVSFRHQMEDWCMARDLQFIPEKSTLEAAGPVHRVTASAIGKGGVLIYLKGEVIFAQIKRGIWTPLGKEMDALYELSHR